MFRFEITANTAAANANNTNSAKALDVIDQLLEKAATAGHWYTEWNTFSANDNKEVRERIRFHYESLGFHITETCQGFRIGFLDAKEETRARDYYNRVAAIMDERVETLGNRIQTLIEKTSNAGYHIYECKLDREELKIIDLLRTKLDEAGFKTSLKGDVLTIAW